MRNGSTHPTQLRFLILDLSANGGFASPGQDYTIPNANVPTGACRKVRRRLAMDDTVRRITAEDINPRFNWGRALPALGIMGVDFEERVDYRRLHRYRLSRVKQALEKS